MEDLGDFLYIIFAIIGVIYSIIRKSNKKTKQSTPPVITENEDETYDNDTPSFDRIFGDTKQTVKPKVTEGKPIISEATKQSVEEKKQQIENNISRIKRSKKHKQEEEEVLNESSDFDFDLRQAVIYSEVLKRPEF